MKSINMEIRVKSRKLFFLSLVAFTTLINQSLVSFSEPSNQDAQMEVKSDSSNAGNSPPPCAKDDSSNLSERIELYHYRNADNVIQILNSLPLKEGCAKAIPPDNLQPGSGVGRGGGNVILLYGTPSYIDSAKRLITAIDLPLPGIKLQLWGIQISSNKPEKLAEVMVKIRSEIDRTQQAVRKSIYQLQGASKEAISSGRFGLNADFSNIAKELGYSEIFNSYGSRSLLDMQIAGIALENSLGFYQDLYDSYLSKSLLDGDSELKPFYDEMRKSGYPPFHRYFKLRGLDYECKELPDNTTSSETQCLEWRWKERKVSQKSILDITNRYERSLFLDFALHYSDFIDNPNDFNSSDLQRTSNELNELLQKSSDALQKDIEDIFIRPTLSRIQKIVSKTKGVSFAQVGKVTISTLNGVETEIQTSSYSAFQLAKPREDFGELLARSESLQKSLSNIIPSVADTGVGSSPLPISRLIGLFVALTEQRATPVEIKTGTNLAFTPGISRNLNSAELNIELEVVDPTITPTDSSERVPSLSRIGKQKLTTSVYTQALDFFDLSTFTSQATVDGGRFRIPVIGTVWNAIFGAIPGFGDLFSFKKPNQKVLHENLLLTTSFITPTSLGLGNLYPHNTAHPNFEENICRRRRNLNIYILNNFQSGNSNSSNSNFYDQDKRCKDFDFLDLNRFS